MNNGLGSSLLRLIKNWGRHFVFTPPFERRYHDTLSGVVVANTILKLSFEQKVVVTHLKLQKLVYFVFRDYYKQTGIKLFDEPFETWTHGPVLPSVYQEFKSFGNKRITRFASDAKGMVTVVDLQSSLLFRNIFMTVWETYKDYDAWELRDMTHLPGTAWSKANDAHNHTLSLNDIASENVKE